MNTDSTSLDRQHDVIVAPPVPFWPPAPAWYWVIGFLCFAGLCGLLAAIIAWQRTAYRREALSEWRECDALLGQHERRREAVARLAVLSKRVALSVYPRERVAALSGWPWTTFLDQHGAGCTLGDRLERPVYDSVQAENLDAHQLQALSNDVKAWIFKCSATSPNPRGST